MLVVFISRSSTRIIPPSLFSPGSLLSVPRSLEFPLLAIHFFNFGFLISSQQAEIKRINYNQMLISQCEGISHIQSFEEGEGEAEM